MIYCKIKKRNQLRPEVKKNIVKPHKCDSSLGANLKYVKVPYLCIQASVNAMGPCSCDTTEAGEMFSFSESAKSAD